MYKRLAGYEDTNDAERLAQVNTTSEYIRPLQPKGTLVMKEGITQTAIAEASLTLAL